jgi:enamine deaminase RidA (YjgF/YER057c/UK114 family)
MSLAPEADRAAALEIEFDAARAAAGDGRPGFRLPLRRLAGAATECLFRAARPAGEKAGFRLFADGDLLIGWSSEPCGGDGEAAAAELYARLLAAAGSRPLCRVWNYVPEINQWAGGRETYCAFNAGRARAFAQRWGDDFARQLPAASAVGCQGAELVALFVAASRPPRHLENPEQIPAYRYPSEHGPFPPSFARATVAAGPGRALTFISGTAAIKGHATVAPASLAAQLDCTLDNLRLISEAAGCGGNLRGGAAGERHFKVYLRHAADLSAVQSRLEADLFRPGDRIVWLEADLCRAELKVEVEATLLAAGADQPP